MNLPMVIEAFMSRDYMSCDELANSLMAVGAMSVVNVNKLLDDYLDIED